MDEDADAHLLKWLRPYDGTIPDMIADPRFPLAARTLSAKMLEAAAADPALDGIVKDAGRFGTTCMAVGLDADGELTLAGLKAMCVRSGLASPGRARAILLYLRFLRYVEPDGQGRYLPTEACRTAWRTLSRCGLDAAHIVEPAVDLVRRRLDEPQAMRAFLSAQAQGGVEAVRRGNPDDPVWRILLNRHAGVQMMHSLMLNAPEEADYPPRGPMPLSISALAKLHRVSRAHVLRLLTAAEREGVLTRDGERFLRLTERGRFAISYTIALRLYGLIFCAARTWQALAPQADRSGMTHDAETARVTGA